jgi:hypothetical protein
MRAERVMCSFLSSYHANNSQCLFTSASIFRFAVLHHRLYCMLQIHREVMAQLQSDEANSVRDEQIFISGEKQNEADITTAQADGDGVWFPVRKQAI